MNDDDKDAVEVDDIAADVRAAAEEVSTRALGDKLATEDSSSSGAPEAAQDRPRDASGKFVKVEAQETAAPEQEVTDADQNTEQPAQNSNSATPPSFLSAEAKAVWSQTPSAIQAALLKRDADANEGGRQWSEQRQQIEQAIAPLHQLSQQNGIDWQEGLNRLLNVESGLRDPRTAAQTVATIAQAYGVDLRALVNGSPQPQRQQPQFDPNIIPQLVERQVTEKLTAYQQDQALNGEIQQFATARGPDGQVTHPHFESVKATMGLLLQNGQAQDMQEAYDKAIWLSPETRPQPSVQANSQQQVQKAKRAAVSVNGAPQNGQVSKANGFDANTSTRDDVREAMRMLSH